MGRTTTERLSFVDLFAGCGGLSLGLLNAGWKGIFAIERCADAFSTLRHNLVDAKAHNLGRPRFDWPAWLNIGPYEIRTFIDQHRFELRKVSGEIDLVAGGPPCQGFSFAGRRTGRDPRNDLFKLQVEIVELLMPAVVLLENVQGIDITFGARSASGKQKQGRPRRSHSFRIRDALVEHGYVAQQGMIRAADFGVPQIRPRFYTIGFRKDLFAMLGTPSFFDEIARLRIDFLKAKGLPTNQNVTTGDAISDLEVTGRGTRVCEDQESPPGFREIIYEGPVSAYQMLMHQGMNGLSPNSLRLVQHRPDTVAKYRNVLSSCRQGVQLTKEDRRRLGIKKTVLAPLAKDRPSHTL